MVKLRLPVLGIIVGLGSIMGCSGTTDTPGGGRGDSGGCPKFDYTNYTPTTSPTLKNDIQPIFMISCSLSSSCHASGSTHPPHLGPTQSSLDGGMVSSAVLQAILADLTRPSTEVPTRHYVVPSKPEDSYLMNKVEGTNACSGFTCVTVAGVDKCGIQMPDPATPLPNAQINSIRDWIKKGAPM